MYVTFLLSVTDSLGTPFFTSKLKSPAVSSSVLLAIHGIAIARGFCVVRIVFTFAKCLLLWSAARLMTMSLLLSCALLLDDGASCNRDS